MSLQNLQSRRAEPYHLPLDEVHYEDGRKESKSIRINGGKLEFELVLQHRGHYSCEAESA